MFEFQGIQFVITNPPLDPVSAQELEAVENELGFLFPDDYRAFVTTFGSGEINLSIRAFDPRDILKTYLRETRDRLAEYWFWNRSLTVLTQAHAVECVPFFDSSFGDDIIFHPSDRTRWFILPHEGKEAMVVQSFRDLCDLYARQHGEQPPFQFSRYE